LNNSFSSPDVRVFAGLTFTGQDLDPDDDGIIGPLDKCPKDPEDKDNFEDVDGCPELDNDRDLITDDIDQCDNEPEDKDGFEDENGCIDPDNDKDAVADANDKCINDPEDKDGFEDQDGCPELDNDQDGITDKLDVCPLKKGTAEFQGCVDTDGDKFVDEKDKCPNEAEDKDGFEDEDGCPDLDNDADGIVDKDDLCPREKEDGKGGFPTDGCPDTVKAVLKEGKVVILDKIFFDTGKTTIKVVSNPVLDGVIKVLNENPQVKKIRVEGNTDDVGDEKKNQKLSEGRAKAVADYLIKNGIDAARIESKGNGESVPLESVVGIDPKKDKKKLEATREVNRRVEFFVVE
jgi:outer membrane protein OmpA-like peptidoglycan-associated protein